MRAIADRGGHEHRCLRRLTAAVLAALMAGPAFPAAAAPATAQVPAPASTLRTAQVQATELRVDVDRLRVEVALAVEAHNAVADELASVVRRQLHADQAADAATATRAASQGRGVRRMRALYMAGGSAAVYAGLLQDGSITDVLRRTQTVAVLAREDASILDADLTQADRAAVVAAENSTRTDEQLRLTQEVVAASAVVSSLLRESTDRLASADADVVRLAEAERVRVEIAAGTRSMTRGADQAPAPAAALAVSAAQSVKGRPYRWGAVGPYAFDCSGLIQWAYRQAGVTLPRVSRDQFRRGTAVSLGALAPGDVLFYAVNIADPASIYHVGMYVGDGQLVQAPRTGAVVQIAPVRLNDLLGAIRPVPSQPSLRTP